MASNDFRKVHMTNGGVVFDLDPSRFPGQYSRAQKWLDNQVIVDSDRHVPFRNGVLRKSARLGTKLGSGEVVWSAPYARYLYYGKVMVGPAPKELTDIDLTYHTPGTGAYWFEKAKGICKKTWTAGVRKLAGGG